MKAKYTVKDHLHGNAVMAGDMEFAILSTKEEAELVASRLNARDGMTAQHTFVDLRKTGQSAGVPYSPEIHPPSPFHR